jgi:hypothetical protein
LDTKIKIAYYLGCKMAEIHNANQLAKTMRSEESLIDKDTQKSEYSDVMRNFEEMRESESSAPYGEKHQLAINPEWSGP